MCTLSSRLFLHPVPYVARLVPYHRLVFPLTTSPHLTRAHHCTHPTPSLSSLVASQYDLSAADLLAHSEQDLWGDTRPTKRALSGKRGRGGARGLSEIRDVLGNAAFTHTQNNRYPGSVRRRRLGWSLSSVVKTVVNFGAKIVDAVVDAVPKISNKGCR